MRTLGELEFVGDDAIIDRGEISVSRAEWIIGMLLNGAVRLWCLPFLLVLWGITWASILLIRGVAALVHAGQVMTGGGMESDFFATPPGLGPASKVAR